MTTKDKILDVSLDLFSRNGYSGVSMDEIGKGVGIKAPSIYKHFKGKEDIFNNIIDKADNILTEKASFLDLDLEGGSLEGLHIEDLGIKTFKYFLHDKFISRVRKMLAIELHKNPETTSIFLSKYIEGPLQGHIDLLKNKEISLPFDLKALALAFYSPIFLALSICDADPTREEELLNQLAEIYKYFNMTMQMTTNKLI